MSIFVRQSSRSWLAWRAVVNNLSIKYVVEKVPWFSEDLHQSVIEIVAGAMSHFPSHAVAVPPKLPHELYLSVMNQLPSQLMRLSRDWCDVHRRLCLCVIVWGHVHACTPPSSRTNPWMGQPEHPPKRDATPKPPSNHLSIGAGLVTPKCAIRGLMLPLLGGTVSVPGLVS